MLRESYDLMDEHKRELAEIIWEGMDQDRILGPCPKCRDAGRKNEQGETNRLRIIRAKKSGKRFVGCEGYPDCDQTYGLPQRGDLIRLEEVCSICGETPAREGDGRPPPLEPVPQRGVPLDGGDARRARRARGRAGRQGGRRGRGRSGDGEEPEDEEPAKEPAPRRPAPAGARRRRARSRA